MARSFGVLGEGCVWRNSPRTCRAQGAEDGRWDTCEPDTIIEARLAVPKLWAGLDPRSGPMAVEFMSRANWLLRCMCAFPHRKRSCITLTDQGWKLPREWMVSPPVFMQWNWDSLWGSFNRRKKKLHTVWIVRILSVSWVVRLGQRRPRKFACPRSSSCTASI